MRAVLLLLSCAVACSTSAPAIPDGAPADARRFDADGARADAPPDATLPDTAPPDRSVDAGPTAFPWTPVPGVVDPSWLASPPACTGTDWLVKYLHYRLRLRGDGTAARPGFVSVGAAAGESLPASMRAPQADCATDWWMNDGQCTQLNAPKSKGKLEWGDSTIWLGWYLATLASEHAAFQKIGVDTSETRADLYYALQAFNRLDKAAETHYGKPPALDGFFQRDDVPPGFIYKPGGGFRFPRAEPGIDGYGCVSSSASCGTPDIADGFYESQDQVIGMIFGLALVEKLVPTGVTHLGVDLRQEARAIMHRMVMHLRDHAWTIRDPSGNSPPNQWGGSALLNSDQIAKAANRICGTAFGVADYRDLLSNTVGVAGFAGIDASWGLQTHINKSMTIKLVAVTGEWNAAKIAPRAAGERTAIFALAHAMLQGVPLDPSIALWELDSDLSSAPCSGPCHNTPGCAEVPGWRGEHRWKSPESRNGDPNGIYGEYNGMDYMVLHNLYLLYRQGQVDFTAPAPPASCSGPTPLDQLLAGGGASYDPFAPCARADLGRRYCGRSFASWLDAAYRKEVTIFTGKGKWTCSGLQPCTISQGTGDGTAGHDLMLGTPGDDVLSGGDGSDCIYGGDGADTLRGGPGRDEIHGGAGNDTICGEACAAQETTGGEDVLFGDDGDDLLDGGPGEDDLIGGAGNDHLVGGAGDDGLFGGDGDDVMEGGDGDDRMYGGAGADEMYGGAGADLMEGDEGRNKLDGGPGDDTLHGGAGDDFLAGGDGDDTLWGFDGNDRLCGGCGKDSLDGGWGPGTNECADAGLWTCLSDPSGTVVACQKVATSTQCSPAAFAAW
jgi:hypothetical protein